MKKSKILVCLCIFVFAGCIAGRKELRYTETVATIVNHVESSPGEAGIHKYDDTWDTYNYVVNGKKYSGQIDHHYFIGEKFIVKYDTRQPSNGKNSFIFYKPVLEATEQTKTTTGVIKTIFEKTNRDILQISFQYSIPVKKVALDSIRARFDTYNYADNSGEKISIENTAATDSVTICFTKLQYLPVSVNANDLKKDLNKKYKVVYSADNFQRAILYVND